MLLFLFLESSHSFSNDSEQMFSYDQNEMTPVPKNSRISDTTGADYVFDTYRTVLFVDACRPSVTSPCCLCPCLVPTPSQQHRHLVAPSKTLCSRSAPC